MEISIEKMNLEHLEQISLEEFDDFWNYNILKSELENTSSYYIIAKENEKIIGFAGLNFILDEAHIANIVTRKDKRNLGVASKMLDTLIKKASENSISITLEVNTQNDTAIHLYKKYGFNILSTRQKYYNNIYDAYIMTKYL